MYLIFSKCGPSLTVRRLFQYTGKRHIFSHQSSRIGRIGILLPNQEARLVDEDENDVNESERGELWIRGDNIMKYVLSHIDIYGWIDWIQPRPLEGFYAIVDRKKELIKYSKAC
ncbi:hypothetical protein BS47DRAFT_1356547 [Hydnum rufescens UP504]|uniref:AMP-dependent synthetase/ligase domain-containing protein n=1 Tax=Hydnum rufescens UP504 TaxID=1448309 RepID=A0A9P6DLE6_9AGAM|nr:hypothetical protein BS47DRAFT_1356547 [Hydnum rufescens UP504]